MVFSIDGLVSGFDTTSIIESLLGFQQSQVDTFNERKAGITQEQSAFKGIEAQLLTFQGSLGQLNRSQNSVFDASIATSSNENLMLVAASSGAAEGTYQLTVEQLATAHQLGSQGFSSTTDQVTQGDYTFTVGTKAAQTITIDSSNNTLAGFVDAINQQVDDVNAGVVFDQGANAYRVLLTSKHTGAENTIAISSSVAGAGTTPDFSGPAVQDAANAIVKLGSGAGAISAQYSNNKVEGLIENVTLDLKSADAGTVVTVDIQRDTTAAQEAIERFVDDFNSIIEFIDLQTQFEPETNQSSPLTGNRSVSVIKNQLLTSVTNTVNVNGGVSRLAQIGVDISLTGKLTLDSGKLSQALNGELEGVDPDDIKRLFGTSATSTNSGIEFILAGPRTKESSTPYQVDITQAAEQASITAGTALAGSTVINSTNNTLQISIDGIPSEIMTLADGTYTPAELAEHVENTINGSSELGVHNVIVSLTGSNELGITTEAYGSSASIAGLSGTALTDLGLAGTEADTGQDVAGKFIVDGVEEVATGSGRVLRGDADNENTADLQLEVTLTSSQVVAGVDGEIAVTEGVTAKTSEYITGILDSTTGLLKNISDDYDARIESIDQSIARVEALTESKRDSLIREFTALETILSELQNTGNFISSQLQSIGAFNQKQNGN